MPLSNSTVIRPPTAATISASASSDAIAPSTWRPPWFDTTMPSSPAVDRPPRVVGVQHALEQDRQPRARAQPRDVVPRQRRPRVGVRGTSRRPRAARASAGCPAASPGTLRAIENSVRIAPSVTSTSAAAAGLARPARDHLQKRGSPRYCAIPSARANGSEPMLRSCGRQPSIVVSSVTTIASHPTASARARNESTQLVVGAPVQLEPARRVAHHRRALLHRAATTGWRTCTAAELRRRAGDRPVGLRVQQLGRARPARTAPARGSARPNSSTLRSRRGYVAQHPRHDRPALERGAVGAHRRALARAARAVGPAADGRLALRRAARASRSRWGCAASARALRRDRSPPAVRVPAHRLEIIPSVGGSVNVTERVARISVP